MRVKRVIKEIVKNSTYSDNFFSEIGILKEIRHENIPIIYDTEETEEYYYIIEEYIEGISLYEFVKGQESLTEDMALKFGIQLTNLITFLHSKKPNPILFLDLQPKNIIVANEKIYLIDFGCSMKEGLQERNIFFGTPGYAAPEQYSGDNISFETDIYGIGALLFFMITGKNLRDGIAIINSKNISQKFKQIIFWCVANNKRYRFKNTQNLFNQLNLLKEKKNSAYSGDKPLVISIAGTENKVGATHISLLMCNYLSELGYNVAYEENNQSDDIRKFAKFHSDCIYSGGVFSYKSLKLIPKYGKDVELSFDYDILVRDEGIYEDCRIYGNYLFLISGSSEWELERLKEGVVDKNRFDGIVLNLCSKKHFVEASEFLEQKGNITYFQPGESVLNDDDRLMFHNLLEEMLKSSDVIKEKKSKKRFSRKIFGRK